MAPRMVTMCCGIGARKIRVKMVTEFATKKISIHLFEKPMVLN